MRVRHRRALRREIEEVYPDLSFWFGLSFWDIVRMPRWAVRMYVDALDRLTAELESSMLAASSYPHMKRAAQRRAAAKLRKRIRAGRPSKSVPQERYEQTLATVGIGYQEVPKRDD